MIITHAKRSQMAFSGRKKKVKARNRNVTQRKAEKLL